MLLGRWQFTFVGSLSLKGHLSRCLSTDLWSGIYIQVAYRLGISILKDVLLLSASYAYSLELPKEITSIVKMDYILHMMFAI